jgi:DNA repair protein RadA/Sms
MASRMNERLNEAAKLGFKSAIIPKRLKNSGSSWPKGIEIHEVRSLHQALEKALLKK